MDGPSTRGTLQIITSCLFTIIICTWSVMHLSLPAPDDGLWTKLLRKLKWMTITAIAPEFALTANCVEHFNAEQLMASLRAKEENGELEGILEPNGDKCSLNINMTPLWTVQQASPGWVLRLIFWLKPHSASRRVKEATDQPLHVFTKTHACFTNQEGFKLQLRRAESRPEGTHAGLWEHSAPFLTGRVLGSVRCQFPYSPLRYLNVSEAEILDKSNPDAFVKVLAAIHILWLASSIVTRWIRQIPVSQFEIFHTCICSDGHRPICCEFRQTSEYRSGEHDNNVKILKKHVH